ncbi:MAG: hypothetical protein ACFFBD_18510 [Candidatus Hodarchaeota archaeon]
MNSKYHQSIILSILILGLIFIAINENTGVNITTGQTTAIIADHTIANMVRLDEVPESAIVTAKNTLHIAYGHTSHGSQIIGGMTNLPAFKEANGGTAGLYDWHDGPLAGALDIDDYFASGDLGNPDRTTWAARTRTYLDNPAHSDVNVVIWSWCGQASSATETDITTYLTLMNTLETDYPSVEFVYMTGHTDGTGLSGNLHIRNNQIRDFCIANGKILYDFADIESYDPDGNYFGDKNVNDNCDYTGGNWAIEWQNSHIQDVEWYSCSAAHSQALNGNLKAYAAWWLWARLAGWNQVTTTSSGSISEFTTNTVSTPSIGIIFIMICIITTAGWRLKRKKTRDCST